MARKMLRSLLAALQLFSLLSRGGGEVVHIHTASYFSFWRKSLFLAQAFLFRRSVVVSLHGGAFKEFYREGCGPVGRWWIRTVIRKATRFIVLTDGWKQWALSLVPAANVRTLPNVCPDLLLAERARNRGRDNPARILFIGRLEEAKGLKDLFFAVSRIRERFPEIKLVCGGTGDEGPVKNWIETAGVGDLVELRGWISGKTKHECFENTDLLVLPSHMENMPMVIIEAMAAGLPVVASAVGGIPDIIEHGKDGLLVQRGDVDGLADAIAMLLGDQTMRNRMGQNARQKYEHSYSVESIIPLMEAMYYELGVTPVS
jgi:glycosyltransferase involved in cell wall biosynthesis